MKPTPRILNTAVSVIAGALLAGGSYALGAGGSAKTIGCGSCRGTVSHGVVEDSRLGAGGVR